MASCPPTGYVSVVGEWIYLPIPETRIDPNQCEQAGAGAARHEGSWWTDWADWLAARSGEKRPAPAVGSARHPLLGDAPDTYVLET